MRRKKTEKKPIEKERFRTETGSRYNYETYQKLKNLAINNVAELLRFDNFLLNQTETTLYRHAKDLWSAYRINLSKTSYNMYKKTHIDIGRARLSKTKIFFYTVFSTAWGIDLFDFCGLIHAKERHEIGADDLPEAWRLPFQP